MSDSCFNEHSPDSTLILQMLKQQFQSIIPSKLSKLVPYGQKLYNYLFNLLLILEPLLLQLLLVTFIFLLEQEGEEAERSEVIQCL